ncbi:MAG: hypothetical protein KBC33_04060 [Candidatus Pacebacteria bacterium]|nr:hypothetical protein [Candidatus Paceibacterota bacterium]
MNDQVQSPPYDTFDQGEEFRYFIAPDILPGEETILNEPGQTMGASACCSECCSESTLALSRIGHLQVGEA